MAIERASEEKNASIPLLREGDVSLAAGPRATMNGVRSRTALLLDRPENPNELVIAERYGSVREMLMDLEGNSALSPKGKDAKKFVVFADKSGIYRFPMRFVRNYVRNGGQGSDVRLFEACKIVSNVERHLPRKYISFEGAFGLIREYDDGMVERLGGEDAVKSAFRQERGGSEGDEVPLGDLRALVFSIYLRMTGKDATPFSIGSYEARVRSIVRKMLGTYVEMPDPNLGSFRIFRDEFSDVLTPSMDEWPKEFARVTPDAGDVVFELFPGMRISSILPKADGIFRLYPEVTRVLAVTNGQGFAIPRSAPPSGGMEALSPFLV